LVEVGEAEELGGKEDGVEGGFAAADDWTISC
jgi:hypothetical protein